LSECAVQKDKKDSVIEALVVLISGTNLQKLVICETFKSCGKRLMDALKPVLIQNQSLYCLNVSHNLIGDAGAGVLLEILQGNQHIREIGFDGLNLSGADGFVRFLGHISSLSHIRRVKRPRKELHRLKSAGKAGANTLKAAWQTVSGRNEVKAAEDDSTTDFSTTSNVVTSSESMGIGMPIGAVNLEASWDIRIPVQADASVWEWEALREQFSYGNITGVSI
jgi:hypothetical protein